MQKFQCTFKKVKRYTFCYGQNTHYSIAATIMPIKDVTHETCK